MLFEPDENGQALVDYSLILLLIAIVIIAALSLFGTQLRTLYEYIRSQWPG